MTDHAWANAIDLRLDDDGLPNPQSIARHIREAVAKTEYLIRAQVVRGLTESYGPFGCAPEELRKRIHAVLDALVRLGDLTEFHSRGGPGYLATPERWVHIGGDEVAVLGASALEPQGQIGLARKVSLDSLDGRAGVPIVQLEEEVGLAAWRLHLVQEGGVDEPLCSPVNLFRRLGELAAGGERLENTSADALRVLATSGEYFGRYDAIQLEGRWGTLKGPHPTCAVRRLQYGWRPCVVTSESGRPTVYDLPDHDRWRWAVVGQTLSQGDPLLMWSSDASLLRILVPPPFQIQRMLDLSGSSDRPWRWQVTADAAALVARYLGTSVH